jgi:hypothetical protein
MHRFAMRLQRNHTGTGRYQRELESLDFDVHGMTCAMKFTARCRTDNAPVNIHGGDGLLSAQLAGGNDETEAGADTRRRNDASQ